MLVYLTLPKKDAEVEKGSGVIIETQRLILDALVQEDAENLYAYRSDPEVARYQGWEPASLEDATDFISKQSNIEFGQPGEWSQLAIRSKQTGELIGDLGISFPAAKEDPIEFGMSLRPAHQGNGHAREVMTAVIDRAFREWGYRRSIASVDPRNTASVALCRRLGFRQEAHHVESYYFRGEWADDLVFAMLAREW